MDLTWLIEDLTCGRVFFDVQLFFLKAYSCSWKQSIARGHRRGPRPDRTWDMGHGAAARSPPAPLTPPRARKAVLRWSGHTGHAGRKVKVRRLRRHRRWQSQCVACLDQMQRTQRMARLHRPPVLASQSEFQINELCRICSVLPHTTLTHLLVHLVCSSYLPVTSSIPHLSHTL